LRAGSGAVPERLALRYIELIGRLRTKFSAPTMTQCDMLLSHQTRAVSLTTDLRAVIFC